MEDEEDAFANAVVEALVAGGEGVVPPLWPYEVANGLWMAERRGRLQPADIPRLLALLDALPIAVRSTAHEHARREVLELARRERLTCYDAAYLELAMREGLPLATLDTQLQAAARHTGVPLFTP